jgi:hypothetical protein
MFPWAKLAGMWLCCAAHACKATASQRQAGAQWACGRASLGLRLVEYHEAVLSCACLHDDGKANTRRARGEAGARVVRHTLLHAARTVVPGNDARLVWMTGQQRGGGLFK